MTLKAAFYTKSLVKLGKMRDSEVLSEALNFRIGKSVNRKVKWPETKN